VADTVDVSLPIVVLHSTHSIVLHNTDYAVCVAGTVDVSLPACTCISILSSCITLYVVPRVQNNAVRAVQNNAVRAVQNNAVHAVQNSAVRGVVCSTASLVAGTSVLKIKGLRTKWCP